MTWIRVMAHWVVGDCGLGKGHTLHIKQKLSCVRFHIHVSDAYVCVISRRNYFKGGRM